MDRHEALEIIKRFDHPDFLDIDSSSPEGTEVRKARVALVRKAQDLLLSDDYCTDMADPCDVPEDCQAEETVNDICPNPEPLPDWIRDVMDQVEKDLGWGKQASPESSFDVPKLGFCERCDPIPCVIVRRIEL